MHSSASLYVKLLAGCSVLALLTGCGSMSPHVTQTPSEQSLDQPDATLTDTPYARQESPYPDLVRPCDDLALPVYEERAASEVGAATELATATLLRLHVDDCRIREAEPLSATRDAGESCKTFNQETFDGRRQRVLRVPSGRTRILLYNTGVQAETGFWIRKMHDEAPVTVASTGGISADSPQMLDLDLEPGHYLYSSPVNPTPDYLLIVEP